MTLCNEIKRGYKTLFANSSLESRPAEAQPAYGVSYASPLRPSYRVASSWIPLSRWRPRRPRSARRRRQSVAPTSAAAAARMTTSPPATRNPSAAPGAIGAPRASRPVAAPLPPAAVGATERVRLGVCVGARRDGLGVGALLAASLGALLGAELVGASLGVGALLIGAPVGALLAPPGLGGSVLGCAPSHTAVHVNASCAQPRAA